MLYQNTGSEYPVLVRLMLVAILVMVSMPMAKPVIVRSGRALEEPERGFCSIERA